MNKNKKNIIKKDLVLLGAGHSNIEILRSFGKKPIKNIRVTLINNSFTSTYSGMIPGYIQGIYEWDEINIDLMHLCNNFSHRFLIESVTKININQNLVHMENRPSISFDYLSINLGIQSNDKDINGAKENCIKLKPISSIKENINKLLTYNKERNKNKIVIIGAGAAGVEVALAIRERLRKEYLYNDIVLLSKNSKILNGFNNNAIYTAEKNLKKNNIKVLYDSEVINITKNYISLRNGSKIKCPFPVLATNAGPLELLKKSNLPLTKNGNIIINKKLLIQGKDNIFATGDIAEIIKNKTPKAGVFAVKQGKILEKNIRRAILNKNLINFIPQRTYLSIIGLSGGKALAIKSIFSCKSKYLWKIKKFIDKRFIKKYSIKKMSIIEINNNTEPYAYKMQCKGCGNKITHNVLEDIFSENIKKGALDADKIPKSNNLYQTTDVISSIITDPFNLGRISAKHALNDIFAAKAFPLSAQMIVSLPPGLNEINKRDLKLLKEGANLVMQQADCKITGGHSFNINDDQIYIGFSIVGKNTNISKDNILKKANLYMTGKIGSALVFSAIEQRLIRGIYAEDVIKEMVNSSFETFLTLRKYKVKYVTDISGFGLAIHANNLLLRDKNLNGLELRLNKVPLYEGAKLALINKVKSSINDSNKSSIINNLNIKVNNNDKYLLNALFDPQTAGGFLFLLKPSEKKVIKELHQKGIKCTLIGNTQTKNMKINIL